MENAARTFHIETNWPEAIVVYMQGVNTPGRLTDPEGKKPGWQHNAGDHGDRDLKFFDAVLASLKSDYKVDTKRIYSTGHSNGGGFTYLLWAARGEHFAAFAPSAAVGRMLAEADPVLSKELARRERLFKRNDEPSENDSATKIDSGEKRDETRAAGERKDSAGKLPVFIPRPVLHVAGEKDPLVKYEWQRLMMNALRKMNQCGEGKPWKDEKLCTIYESKANAPVVTFIHPGTHKYPEEAPAIIVKFFKEHSKPSKK